MTNLPRITEISQKMGVFPAKKIALSLFLIGFSSSTFAQTSGEQSYKFFVLDTGSRSSVQSSSDFSFKKGNICGRIKDENYSDGYSDESWLSVPIEIADQTQIRNIHKFLDSPSSFEVNAASYCEYIITSSNDQELLTAVQKISFYREVPQ